MQHSAPVAEYACAPVTRCHEVPCGQASIYSSLLNARENAVSAAGVQIASVVATSSPVSFTELSVHSFMGAQLKLLLKDSSSLPLRI
jgi:hypothetical protein